YLIKGREMPTRREFSKALLGSGLSALTAGPGDWRTDLLYRSDGKTDFLYDLVVKGGTVIDPSIGLRKQLDIGVKDGKIAEVSPNISADKSQRVISAIGKLVTPGLIDLHVHVYEGVTESGINADH